MRARWFNKYFHGVIVPMALVWFAGELWEKYPSVAVFMCVSAAIGQWRVLGG